MKTHKLITNYIIAAFSFVMIQSCSDNINFAPEGVLSANSYFTSVNDYEKSLNGVYAMLNVDNHNLWIDGSSDNALVTHSWNRGYDLGRGLATTFSSFPEHKWEKNYVAVQRANTVIENIDVYDWPGGTQDESRLQILGEAKALRAYFYLDLTALFGYIMLYENNPATVEESAEIQQIEDPKVAFDFVLKELEEAIAMLPEVAPDKSRLGVAGARLMRARAAAYAAGYLSDKSYFSITLSETNALLGMSHTLGNYEDLFTYGNEGLSEVILTRQYAEDKKNNWGDWYNNSISGYCVTSPVKALVDAYEYLEDPQPNMPYTNKDPRFYATVYAPGMIIRDRYYNTIPANTVERDGRTYFDPAKDYGSLQDREVMVGDVLGETGNGEWNKTPTGFTFKKYFVEDDTWNTWNHLVILRFAEAYLLRAEALVETGGSESEAKQLIRTIRERAGNTNDIDQMISTKYGNLLNLVRNETRVEMAHEGLRIYDIRRWKIMLDVMNEPGLGIEYRVFGTSGTTSAVYEVAPDRKFSERDYWWPIPQEEINLNKGRIKQNDGW